MQNIFWTHGSNPCRFLVHIMKFFNFWIQICRDIPTFHAFCVFSVNVQTRFAYSQYMNRFIPHIHSTGSDSYSVFCEYTQLNSVWSFTSFRVYSEYVQIHSAYFQYIRTDPSRAFSVYEQIHSAYSANGANNFKYSEIELFSSQLLRNTSSKDSKYVCKWTQDPQGIINYFALALQKISFRVSDNTRNDLQIRISWRFKLYW